MNTAILNQYKIKFQLLTIHGRPELQIISDVIPYFPGYFEKTYPSFLEEEVLPEIDKALSGQAFDPDAGGQYHFLVIGNNTSYFQESPVRRYPIPTADVKEIILSYLEWIETNNYEQYI